jgi:hypothetical protein
MWPHLKRFLARAWYGARFLLWQNPANFNSGGTTVSQTFTPPAGATEVQFGYMVTMDKGWLAFSEPQLQWLAPGDTITRKTYALGGKPIATRISGNQEGDNDLPYATGRSFLLLQGNVTVLTGALWYSLVYVAPSETFSGPRLVLGAISALAASPL